MALDLQEFDMNKIINNPKCMIMIIGKKNTGKSYVAKDILAHVAHKLPLVVVMSGSEGQNKFFSKMLPDICIYTDIRTSKFGTIKDRHIGFLAHVENRTNNCAGLVKNIGLVLDDGIANTDWTKDDAMNDFIANGRHIDMLLIIVSQSLKKLSTLMRTNADYTFLMTCNNFGERKNIREELMGGLAKNKFDRTFDKYTNNYGCIVIDNNTKSTEMSDLYFTYKSNPNLWPKLCHPVYWKLNEKMEELVYREIYKKEKSKANFKNLDNS